MMGASNGVNDITSRKPENIGVFTNPAHELYLKTDSIPKPGPGQCLVHVRATGICGSDVHFWKKGHIGSMIVVGENRLGHESAGVVIDVGEGVTRYKPGEQKKNPLGSSQADIIMRRSCCDRMWSSLHAGDLLLLPNRTVQCLPGCCLLLHTASPWNVGPIPRTP